MADILAENLSGKSVMGSDGTEIGILYNITMDVKTGQINDLLVSPNEETPTSRINFDRDEQGRFRIPVSAVRGDEIKDYLVVER